MSRAGLDYERVEFSEVYHSATQGPHKPMQAILRDAEDLRKALPDSPVPSVDFPKEQLIVVALGDKPTTGYDVRITSVMYFTDRLKNRPPLTIVSYSDQEKGGPSELHADRFMLSARGGLRATRSSKETRSINLRCGIRIFTFVKKAHNRRRL